MFLLVSLSLFAFLIVYQGMHSYMFTTHHHGMQDNKGNLLYFAFLTCMNRTNNTSTFAENPVTQFVQQLFC